MPAKRYCIPCDDLVKGNPCPECGADTDRWPIAVNPREKGDDDGQEYGHPRDRREGRE